MEDLSQIAESVRLPVHIPVYPYLTDHRFEGRVVLPAVETMRVMAETTKVYRPETDITGMNHARFDKFLYVPADTTIIDAFCDIAIYANGDIKAALLTKTPSRKSTIVRIKEHGTLCFPACKPDVQPPRDLTPTPDGVGMEIAAEKIYRDLVPFGKTYRNIRGQLMISEVGATAGTHARSVNKSADNFADTGSPFPLDAAFHAACVWGQRYAQTVAFPVGIEKRVIFKPTQSGTTYLSRIIPVRKSPQVLTFDIWIYGKDGKLYEGVCGVDMRDVSAGRLKPPRWIMAATPGPPAPI